MNSLRSNMNFRLICLFILVSLESLMFSNAQVIEVDRISDDRALTAAVAEMKDHSIASLGVYEGRISFAHNGKTLTLDDNADVQGGKYPQLYVVNDQIYAFWWIKLEDTSKKLLFRSSDDQGKTWGDIKTINSGEAYQVLPRYKVVISPNNKIGVVYLDERNGYGIYYNYSLDGGKSWLNHDILLSRGLDGIVNAEITKEQLSFMPYAIYPDLYLLDDQSVVATWTEYIPRTSLDGLSPAQLSNKVYTHIPMIKMAFSKDFGKTWNVSTVYKSDLKIDSLAISLKTFFSGQRWIVAAQLDIGFVISISDDQGKTWQTSTPKQVEGAQRYQSVNFALAGDYVWAAYEKYRNDSITASYFNIYDLKTKEWLGEKPLLSLVGMDTSAISESGGPQIFVFNSKELVVAWNENGMVVPSIMLSYYRYTDDEWKMLDQKVLDLSGEEKLKSQKLLGINKNEQSKDMFSVYVQNSLQYGGEMFNRLRYDIDVIDGKLHGKSLKNFVVEKDLTERKEQLKVAFEAYWAARIAGDDGTAYKYLDPYYRQQNSLRDFIRAQFVMEYKSYQTSDISIDVLGYRAKAKVEMTYNIKPSTDPSRPRDGAQDASQTLYQDWVYIDGKWYTEIRGGMNKRSYIK